MTAPTVKHVLAWIGIGGLVALLGAASSVGVARYQLGEKADRTELREEVRAINSRFHSDSLERAQDRQILMRVDRRVRAMYCAGKPPGCE